MAGAQTASAHCLSSCQPLAAKEIGSQPPPSPGVVGKEMNIDNQPSIPRQKMRDIVDRRLAGIVRTDNCSAAKPSTVRSRKHDHGLTEIGQIIGADSREQVAAT